MHESPLVSIIIPTYNSIHTLKYTLQSCLNQDYPENKLEIIVVDDGSTDGTRKVVLEFPVKYIHQNNRGPASARNRGWMAAQGEIVCFTDSDCIPHRMWVQTLMKGFTNDDIGAVAGSYGIANNNIILANCIHEEIMERHGRMPNEVCAFGSYNVAIKRDILKKIGGFNENYRIASGEDNDLSYRILKAGYKICFARYALVAHYHPERLFKYLKEQFRHGYWRMKLYRAHPDMMSGDHYTNWKDIIEPPLSLLLLGLIPFYKINTVGHIIIILLTFYSFIQIILPLRVVWRNKSFKYLYLFWITFLRGFSRGLGMFVGVLKFGILCERTHSHSVK